MSLKDDNIHRVCFVAVVFIVVVLFFLAVLVATVEFAGFAAKQKYTG